MTAADSLDDDLRLANALADAARLKALPLFRTPLEIIDKADASPVTRADREAESAMREILARERPADGIFGEEFGEKVAEASSRAFGAEGAVATRTWVLDPIDGTRSFITGSPLWGTLIGLVRDGRVALGLIDMPVLGERWVGRVGFGAQRDGRAVRTRACESVADARIMTTSPDLFEPAGWQAFDRLSRRCAMRRFGGDCYAYAQLAGGGIDLVVESGLKPYDYLGPAGLIEAAGGVVTDWQGRPLGLGSDGHVIAAATPALHREALATLAG